MKKRKKYSYGSKVVIEKPNEALAQNQIDLAKADLDSMENPFIQTTKMLGQLGQMATAGSVPGGEYLQALQQFTQLMAYGGEIAKNVPVEVEGDEVAETPQGDLLEFKGSKHEQGGIKTNLPEGTEVYSDRIKVEGETLAKRKAKREKRLNKLQKMLTDTFDPLLEKTKKRIEANNEKVEEFDKGLQELANKVVKKDEGIPKFKYGTSYNEPPVIDPITEQINTLSSIMNSINPDRMQQDLLDKNLQELENPYLNRGPKQLMNPQINTNPQVDSPNYFQEFSNLLNKGQNVVSKGGEFFEKGFDKLKEGVQNFDKDKFKSDIGETISKLPEITTGDALGMASSLAQSFLPLKNTLTERATDTVNPNYYENYGEDALREMEDAQGLMQSNFETQTERLARSKRTQKSQADLSARGLSQKRAMNLAAEQQYQDSFNQAYSAFNQQLMGLVQGKAKFKADVDRIRMGGEEKADIANRQDKANFYTQRGQDLMSMTESLQNVAKNLNEAEYRESMEYMLNTLYDKYNIKIEMRGGLEVDKEKSKLKTSAKDGRLKENVPFEDLLISGDEYQKYG